MRGMQLNMCVVLLTVSVLALRSVPRHRVFPHTKGIDLSTLAQPENYKCMKEAGFSFAIPRAYTSLGFVDTNVCQNIKNAHLGGLDIVELYMFPCPKCYGKGNQQMIEVVRSLKSQGCSYQSPGKNQSFNQYSRIWLDVEGDTDWYWWKEQDRNALFLSSLMQGCADLGVECGVYSSALQWRRIMGNYTGTKHQPLWLAFYEKSSCSILDWTTFGGWNDYLYQQYQGDRDLCGFKVDFDCALTHVWTL
eukprot:gb/GEZN01007959.1/.p1 GENE.gb/GEZN01007959.1/~~gb/GEZN01007959.1/.p1  ORF type:complete len:248 (+),score=24.32 gb/GEZN01007959.1/:53-796(+)